MTTFKTLEADDIVRANPSEVTIGLWPGDVGVLSTFFTSSAQTTQLSGEYYYNIFNANPQVITSASTCFGIAYGHRTGLGAPTLIQVNTASLSTQAVYSQYRNLLLNPGDTQFTFAGNFNTDQIYVINVNRSLMKERLDPGNWQLTLSGSNGLRTFIDDSGQSLGTAFGKSGEFFNVVSGSLSGPTGATIVSASSATSGGFGLFYPSLGIIVFNPLALAQTVGITSATLGNPTSPVYNHRILFNSIVGGSSFVARSSENISSTHFFLRMRSREFNYSNNPTFYNSTNGALTQPTFIQDPRTYATTFGLYNAQNELLAVAKPSRPLPKGFDREVNVKVRLDF